MHGLLALYQYSVGWFTVYTIDDLSLAELSPAHKRSVNYSGAWIVEECIVPGMDAGELALKSCQSEEVSSTSLPMMSQ